MNDKLETNEPVEETKKIPKKKLIIIIIIIFITLTIAVTLITMIYSRKKAESKDENIKYLISTYGELTVNILSSKKNKTTYYICSKRTPFCTTANYNQKKQKWTYPKSEGYIYTIVFMDQAISVLEKNNIKYMTYVDSTTSHDIPNNFILVIKKEDTSQLTNAIIEINNNNLISKLCNNNDQKCPGKFEINIFNSEEYDLITRKYKHHYGIDNYVKLYEYLYKVDNAPYGIKSGKNIERHNIGNNMFNCSDEDCTKCRHIAYRYVIGNHNHVENTMIIEGIN